MNTIKEIEMDKYKVSVIVPIYNVAKYLRDCLESLARQEFCGLQVIMVDDASTDESNVIATEYTDKYKNFTLVKHENNRGLSAARNTGLLHANGKYILFLDSDDYLADDALKRLYNVSEENELDVLKFDYCANIDENSELLDLDVVISEDSDIKEGWEFISQVQKDPSCCLILIRKNVIIDNNLSFLEGVIHEDNLFFAELMLSSKRVMTSNLMLYYRRIRNGSITQTEDYYKMWISFIHMASQFDMFVGMKREYAGQEIAWLLCNAYQAFVKLNRTEIKNISQKWIKTQRQLVIKYWKYVRIKELLVYSFPSFFLKLIAAKNKQL